MGAVRVFEKWWFGKFKVPQKKKEPEE